MNTRHRGEAIDLIAGFDTYYAVVIAAPLNVKRQERVRALCLRRLVWDLGEQGITRLSLEARTSSLIKKDMRTIEALRGTGEIAKTLRVEHEQPSGEPMLWVADQVLGAVGATLSGDTRWFEQIAASVDIVRIEA